MTEAAPREDRLLGFSLPKRDMRGRMVLLDGVLNDILGAHAYSPPIARLLAEALTLAALIGGVLRPDAGQMTLQARGKGGPVELLVADYRNGEIRGYASQNFDVRFSGGESLRALMGEGHLAITLDQFASDERYQGIIELGGETLEATADHYFSTSEQVPTIVRIATRRGSDGRLIAGGMLLQHMARAEEGGGRLHLEDGDDSVDHVRALVGTLGDQELTDATLSNEELLWRLFHEEEEVRLFPPVVLRKGCRCSPEHIAAVLGRFSEGERAEMRNAEGRIVVDCEFCAKQFRLDL